MFNLLKSVVRAAMLTGDQRTRILQQIVTAVDAQVIEAA